MKSEATTLLAAEAKSGSRVGTASLLLHGPTARGTVLADIVVWRRSLNEPLIFKDRMASAAGRSVDAQSACACPLAAGPVGSATGSAGEDAGSRRNVPSPPHVAAMRASPCTQRTARRVAAADQPAVQIIGPMSMRIASDAVWAFPGEALPAVPLGTFHRMPHPLLRGTRIRAASTAAIDSPCVSITRRSPPGRVSCGNFRGGIPR